MVDLVFGLTIGFLAGFGITLYWAACSMAKNDRKAIDSGIIKLDGKYYLLEKIED